MSKDQTPIEELVIRLADLYTDLGNAKRPDQGMKLVSTITEEIEQYAQAKVLEALEKGKTKIVNDWLKEVYPTSTEWLNAKELDESAEINMQKRIQSKEQAFRKGWIEGRLQIFYELFNTTKQK